jgi:hypothetical protein
VNEVVLATYHSPDKGPWLCGTAAGHHRISIDTGPFTLSNSPPLGPQTKTVVHSLLRLRAKDNVVTGDKRSPGLRVVKYIFKV